MIEKDNGGPAFPNSVRLAGENLEDLRGMTMRDYFAAKAMQGALFAAQKDWSWIPEVQHKPLAAQAFQIADAMLEARK